MRGERSLAEHVALVTGASSGLGRATAIGLARAGASVALLARSTNDLEETASVISRSGTQCLAVAVDLANASEVIAAAEHALAELGRVDVLVNAAATDASDDVEHLAEEEWDRVLAVNLRAPFLLSKAVIPSMRRIGRGTIVNISSVAGKRGWANAAAYCASKFALTGFTQALAAEARPHGIRVCIVYPGAMQTAWGRWSEEERATRGATPQSAVDALPPEQVADLIAWLAAAPPELVLNEAIVTPLLERGWP